MKKIKIPKKGDKIYVPGAMYVYRGEDDFVGGKATISEVTIDKELPVDNTNSIFISIEERPGVGYNWEVLKEKQKDLKKQYGDMVCHPDPDTRPEFNCPDADWEEV